MEKNLLQQVDQSVEGKYMHGWHSKIMHILLYILFLHCRKIISRKEVYNLSVMRGSTGFV